MMQFAPGARPLLQLLVCVNGPVIVKFVIFKLTVALFVSFKVRAFEGVSIGWRPKLKLVGSEALLPIPVRFIVCEPVP